MRVCKRLAIALAVASTLGAASLSHAATTIKVANFFPDTHPNSIALKETFAKEVESRSHGELKVRVFSNGVLGAEEKLYNSVRGGTVQMAILGTIMDKEVKNVGIIQLPFLFQDYSHAQKALNSDVGDALVSDMSANTGLHFLAYGVQGFRVVASNKPISSMDDFKGLRLRFPGMESMIAIGNALGANVTPMPISEVFSALEQKVVDGVENPYPNIVASKWYEIVKHVTETNHVFTPNLYLMNDSFWNTLTDEQKAIVQQAAKDASEQEWKLLVASEAKDKEKLQQEGVTITVPDASFRAALVAAEQGSYSKFYEGNPDARAIVEKINAMGAAQ
ncbi:TRAP transporter substrate-binding protein [Pokkaliibacter sp. MBI-7]|uniref:TRAP transporter substrate-binding protein n=1 Tax=Pokkaliibacter sp. MBI-7 TaxID=3040600 RepID=UPI0024472D7F|nr:TRAP transporter substrate-binding protein [Pokkaliibacter sp. MBI-7]MDH2435247.1 TRAP transporter substrate-binding protein [Pokkaliibacter sp. MBI-7]